MKRRPVTSSLFPYTTLFRSLKLRSDLGLAGTRLRLRWRATRLAVVAARAVLPGLHLPIQQLVDVLRDPVDQDRKSTRLNSSHANTSYAVFCLKKKINDKAFG